MVWKHVKIEYIFKSMWIKTGKNRKTKAMSLEWCEYGRFKYTTL